MLWTHLSRENAMQTGVVALSNSLASQAEQAVSPGQRRRRTQNAEDAVRRDPGDLRSTLNRACNSAKHHRGDLALRWSGVAPYSRNAPSKNVGLVIPHRVFTARLKAVISCYKLLQ